MDSSKIRHVIVGMSGGVDSSVAAMRLVQQGYQVSGIFMQNWEDDVQQGYQVSGIFMQNWEDDDEHCTAADEYWERVFAHFLTEYRAGRTPNPDILCNKEIKFSAFLDHAYEQGADAIATGHYANIGYSDNQVQLLRGCDNNKDQSYFLHTLNQNQVSSTLFPIGDLDKSELRQMAQDAGIHVHNKKDSTGICFIGERKFNTFLSEYLPAQPGKIITDAGNDIGTHNGLMFYTLGQRQGLGIGGQTQGDESPWYVLAKDVPGNTLIVGQGHDHPMLFRDNLTSHNVHWVAGRPPAPFFRCTAKVRYRQQDQAVQVRVQADGRIQALFDEPIRAITPGQSIVLYQEDVCLGGGVISDFAENVAALQSRQASHN